MWSDTGQQLLLEILDFILHDSGKQWKRKVMIMAYTFLKSIFHSLEIKRLLSSILFSLILELNKYISPFLGSSSYIPRISCVFPMHNFSFKINVANVFMSTGLKHTFWEGHFCVFLKKFLSLKRKKKKKKTLKYFSVSLHLSQD